MSWGFPLPWGPPEPQLAKELTFLLLGLNRKIHRPLNTVWFLILRQARNINPSRFFWIPLLGMSQVRSLGGLSLPKWLGTCSLFYIAWDTWEKHKDQSLQQILDAEEQPLFTSVPDLWSVSSIPSPMRTAFSGGWRRALRSSWRWSMSPLWSHLSRWCLCSLRRASTICHVNKETPLGPVAMCLTSDYGSLLDGFG